MEPLALRWSGSASRIKSREPKWLLYFVLSHLRWSLCLWLVGFFFEFCYPVQQRVRCLNPHYLLQQRWYTVPRDLCFISVSAAEQVACPGSLTSHLLHKHACADPSPGNWLEKVTDVQFLSQRTWDPGSSSVWILVLLSSFKKSFHWVYGSALWQCHTGINCGGVWFLDRLWGRLCGSHINGCAGVLIC